MTDDWVDGKKRTLGCPATRRAEAYIAAEWRKQHASTPAEEEHPALPEEEFKMYDDEIRDLYDRCVNFIADIQIETGDWSRTEQLIALLSGLVPQY